MALIKTAEEIKLLREGGKRLADVLYRTAEKVSVGMTGRELDLFAEAEIRKRGDQPAFKNYQPGGADFPFPATLCVSVNDELVHCIPDDLPLTLGDIVGLDLGIIHEGLITDMAITVSVGAVSKEDEALLRLTRESLAKGIAAVRAGARIGDIGYAIESHVLPHGLGIVRELGGHGVGHEVHEGPYIPNYGRARHGELLREGMVIAIEPIISRGSEEIVVADDNFGYRTKDGSRSAHFEHTVAVTKDGAIILTTE